MAEDRALPYGSVLPATWLAALQEFVGMMSGNFTLSLATHNTVAVVAGTLSAQVAVGIDGLFRYIDSTITLAVAGAAGSYDIYVTTGPNSFTTGAAGSGETDNTNYAFALNLQATGNTPTVNGSTSNYRKVGSLDWDGTNVTHLRQFYGMGDTTQPLMPTADQPTEIAVRAVGTTSQTAAIQTWETATGTVLARIAPAALTTADSSTSLATTALVQAFFAQTMTTAEIEAYVEQFVVSQTTGGASEAYVEAYVAEQLVPYETATQIAAALAAYATTASVNATTQNGAALYESGDLIYSAATTRAGAILCNGQAVLRASYPALNALAAAVGYAAPWGTGNGSTTFNVPNYENVVLVGAGGSYALGTTGGASTATLGVANMPSHRHPVVFQDVGHAHLVNSWTTNNPSGGGAAEGGGAEWTFGGVEYEIPVYGTLATGQTEGNTVAVGYVYAPDGGGESETSAVGNGSAFAIEQPFAAVNVFIKT